MTPHDAIELGRNAIMCALLVAAPILLAGMVVGLIVGLLQALTQVQEQTVAFVPKLFAMLLVLGLAMPWVLDRLVDYSQRVFAAIPDLL